MRPICGAGCTALSTDAVGRATVTAPASAWLGVHVYPRASTSSHFLDTRTLHVLAPSTLGGTMRVRTVADGTINLLRASSGFAHAPGAALVLGDLRDCDGERVRGAIVRVFRPDGSEITFDRGVSEGPHVVYYDGIDMPDGSSPYTQVDGAWAVMNLPAIAETELRVEAWGHTERLAPTVRVACETIPLGANGAGVLPLGPTRSDYPAGHPCLDGP